VTGREGDGGTERRGDRVNQKIIGHISFDILHLSFWNSVVSGDLSRFSNNSGVLVLGAQASSPAGFD